MCGLERRRRVLSQQGKSIERRLGWIADKHWIYDISLNHSILGLHGIALSSRLSRHRSKRSTKAMYRCASQMLGLGESRRVHRWSCQESVCQELRPLCGRETKICRERNTTRLLCGHWRPRPLQALGRSGRMQKQSDCKLNESRRGYIAWIYFYCERKNISLLTDWLTHSFISIVYISTCRKIVKRVAMLAQVQKTWTRMGSWR